MSLVETIRAMPARRQAMLGGAVLAVVLLMSLLARGAMTPPMAVLYSGLEADRSGEVMDALEQRGIAYEVRGTTLLVAAPDRDATRLALAAEGLPRSSVQGYELLDEVNGFSVTSQMYSAAYWRAKEGELTRTILAMPGVERARVHISAAPESGFRRDRSTRTASVTLSAPRQLTQGQAEAIQYLVALAVPSLKPGEVAVIDASAGVIAGPGQGAAAAPPRLAADEAERIEAKLTDLLEARVGPGMARVSVSLDLSRDTERTQTVTFDPESRVVSSRQTADASEEAEGATGGLTVASNLPEGEASRGSNASSTTRSTESVTYAINETRTERERLPGQVQRLSVAVMVDEAALGLAPAPAAADGSGPAIAPDPAARTEAARTLQGLVAAAAGIVPERGDTVTVEILPFQPREEITLAEPPSAMSALLERHFWALAQGVMLLVTVLALLFGVVRPLLSAGRGGNADGGAGALDFNGGFPPMGAAPALAGAAMGEGAGPGAGMAMGMGMGMDGEGAGPGDMLDGGAPGPGFAGLGQDGADPALLLQEAAAEQQDDAVALLQHWIGDEAGSA